MLVAKMQPQTKIINIIKGLYNKPIYKESKYNKLYLYL